MNCITICGRLCRDPETRCGQESGKTVARFTVAVSRPFMRDGKRESDFFKCVSFGKNADFVEKYMKRGMKVVVRGRMENDNYTDKDGNKVYDWQLVCDEIDFGESKKDNGEEAPTEKEAEPVQEKFMEIPDDLDVPFA